MIRKILQWFKCKFGKCTCLKEKELAEKMALSYQHNLASFLDKMYKDGLIYSNIKLQIVPDKQYTVYVNNWNLDKIDEYLVKMNKYAITFCIGTYEKDIPAEYIANELARQVKGVFLTKYPSLLNNKIVI